MIKVLGLSALFHAIDHMNEVVFFACAVGFFTLLRILDRWFPRVRPTWSQTVNESIREYLITREKNRLRNRMLTAMLRAKGRMRGVPDEEAIRRYEKVGEGLVADCEEVVGRFKVEVRDPAGRVTYQDEGHNRIATDGIDSIINADLRHRGPMWFGIPEEDGSIRWTLREAPDKEGIKDEALDGHDLRGRL